MTARAWALLRTLAGVAILGVLGWRLGTGAFVDGLRVITVPSLLAALGIGLLTTVASAWRWALVARRLGLRLPLAKAVQDYYRALFLNAVLPAGVLGDVHRAVDHGRQAGDVGRGVRAVVLERVAGQVVLLVLGAAVLLTQPALLQQLALSPPATAAVLVALVTVVAFAAWTRWGTSTSKVRRASATAFADARRGLLARGTWPGVVVASAGALAGYLALFVVAAHTAGVAASLGRLLPPMVLALIVMALPVNVGGWGPREAVLAMSFGVAGLGAAQGLTTAVVYGVLTLVASLPGAVVLFAGRKVTAAAPAPARIPQTI